MMQKKFFYRQAQFLSLFFLAFSCFSAEQNASKATHKESDLMTQENIEKITIIGEKPQKEVISDQTEDDWVNQFHSSLSDSVYQSAVWFDGFFNDAEVKQLEPKANARIRLAWEPEQGDLQQFDTRFRFSVKLPHFENKLDLILSDTDDTTIDDLPLESIKKNQQVNDEKFAAAVRFVHWQGDDQYTSTRLGISGGDIFVRSRFMKRFAWNESHAFRFEPSIYYYIDDGLGSKLLLEYDFQLNPKHQFRINYSIRGSESFNGIKWKHGVYHLTQFSDKQAGAFGVVVEGERYGDNGFQVDNYTLSYRYRFNAYRKWLYFEVEPFVEWPNDDNYHSSPGIALRVEGYFYKN